MTPCPRLCWLRSMALVSLALCSSTAALADARRMVVLRAGGEGLPAHFAEDVELAVRASLENNASVALVSREQTRDGIATGREVGVACGADDLECYRKLAVLVEADDLLLLRLLPRQGGVVVELVRAEVGSGKEQRRIARRLVTSAPVDALVARAVADVLAVSPPPVRVAVVPFDDGGTGLLARVEAAARAELTSRAGVVLAADDALRAALAESEGCAGMKPRCLAALGARIGVDKVLYGALREGDGRPTAGVHLLDVVALTQRSSIGDVDGLGEDVPAALAHLLDEDGTPTKVASRPEAADATTGALFMAGAGGTLLVVGGASAATGLLFGGAGPARTETSPDAARAAVTLAVPALAVGAGLVAGSLLWLTTSLTE